jgi:Cu+-exporting ATPase
MTVDGGSALSLEHGGRRYYFCGPGCRDTFAAEPERYAAGSAAPPRPEQAHAHHH